ncbi:hypothetical protein WICPIJ_000441 [Wickerhamomyces pijperi]|uniref:Bola-like protein n=1 Tax=Wickerhamomyces pijperi TaxID=599730 RepID=A0A9P8QDK5_WICPI|nr:hypothetical protein WICPIJ_000441 [Wickerhamomyces pijperi]
MFRATGITKLQSSATRFLNAQTTTRRSYTQILSDLERQIHTKLMRSHLQPTSLEVSDISGGCGSMFAINIVSPEFKGLGMVKQHKLVNEVLKEEIKGWHGLQLSTKAE